MKDDEAQGIPEFLPGDLVLFKGLSTWTARAIRSCQRRVGESPSIVNHVGIMIDRENLMEALARIRRNPLSIYLFNPDYEIYIFRHNGLDEGERIRISEWICRQEGRFYAPLKILAHLGDHLIGKISRGDPRIFRRIIFSERFFICSELAARAYYEEPGYKFLGMDPQEVTPDDIWDHILASKDWEEVYINK